MQAWMISRTDAVLESRINGCMDGLARWEWMDAWIDPRMIELMVDGMDGWSFCLVNVLEYLDIRMSRYFQTTIY